MDALHDLIFGSGVAIKQCQAVDHSNNFTLVIGRDSGDVDPALIGVMEAEPTTTVTSLDVAGVLGIFGVTTGASVSAGTVTIPMTKRAAGSTFAGTSSHFTMTGANAFGYMTSCSAQQGQDAQAQFDIMHLSTNGQAAPLSSATGATLSANAYNAQYTLGPAKIDGTEVPEITGITVNTGLTVETRRYGGAVYPTVCVITQRNPSIDLTVADFDEVDTYGPLFVTNDSIDAVAYFRKCADGSTRVADATEEHIAFTLSDGITTVENFSGQDTSDGSATIRITGKSLAVSTTSAISFA